MWDYGNTEERSITTPGNKAGNHCHWWRYTLADLNRFEYSNVEARLWFQIIYSQMLTLRDDGGRATG